MAARVRIEPRHGSGIIQAELVDVSAGGLRAVSAALPSLENGRDVDVEISVQEPGPQAPAPLVNLRGQGRVVRVERANGHFETALMFTGALSVREPFSQMLLF